MFKLSLVALATLLMFLSLGAQAVLFGKDKSVDEQRQATLDMRKDVLARLYKEKPSVENMVAGSVGYAVFSNTGVNV